MILVSPLGDRMRLFRFGQKNNVDLVDAYRMPKQRSLRML